MGDADPCRARGPYGLSFPVVSGGRPSQSPVPANRRPALKSQGRFIGLFHISGSFRLILQERHVLRHISTFFQTSVETCVKFCRTGSTLSPEEHKGSKGVGSLLSFNLTPHRGEEAVARGPCKNRLGISDRDSGNRYSKEHTECKIPSETGVFSMHVDGDQGRLSGKRVLSGVGDRACWAVVGKDIKVEERAWHGLGKGGPGTCDRQLD